MPSRKVRLAGVLLAGSLVFPLFDFALGSLASGVASDAYSVAARPLAFFIALSLIAVAGGALLGSVLSLILQSGRATILGCAFGGAVSAAVTVAMGSPPQYFSSRPMQLTLAFLIWAFAAWLLTLAALGLERREKHRELVARLLRAAPPLLAATGGYLVLAYFAPGWRLAALASGVALAALCWARTSEALLVHGSIAAMALAAPWVGPTEPRLEFESNLIGSSADLVPPRVILISVDTLRASDLGFLGGTAIQTPGFDRLSADSVVFEQAYSTSGWTLTAFSSLHLGVSPWVHGAFSPVDRPSAAPLSLAERFSQAGYRTAKISYNMFLTEALTGPVFSKGFQLLDDYPAFARPQTRAYEFLRGRSFLDIGATSTTDDLFDWAETFVELSRHEPFFLWLHIFDPHQPYLPKAEFAPGGVPIDWRDPDAKSDVRPKTPEQVERMRALYLAEIGWVDARLGAFLDLLQALELYDDALIAFVSDHGEEFLEHGGFSHGHTLYNELLHVPLTFKLPHRTLKGRIAGRVSTLSFAPTLLELAGIPYEPRDFSAGALPMEGEAAPGPLFAAGNYGAETRESVIFDRYKLIRIRDFGQAWLYDLEADPGEQYNIAYDRPKEVARGLDLLSEQAQDAAALRERLGVVETQRGELQESERKLLRSLGYLQ